MSSSLLQTAVSRLLPTAVEEPDAAILWTMQYNHASPMTSSMTSQEGTLHIPAIPPSLVLEDDVLRSVRRAWEDIVGDDIGDGFMNFKAREGDGQGHEAEEEEIMEI